MAYTKKIEIQVLAEVTDEIGQRIPGWETIFRPWASISSTIGKEYYEAAQVNSEDDKVFKVRYSRKIAGYLTSQIRIVYAGEVYDVKSVGDYQEQHRELVFRAVNINRRKTGND